jgi:hypothetical protein
MTRSSGSAPNPVFMSCEATGGTANLPRATGTQAHVILTQPSLMSGCEIQVLLLRSFYQNSCENLPLVDKRDRMIELDFSTASPHLV